MLLLLDVDSIAIICSFLDFDDIISLETISRELFEICRSHEFLHALVNLKYLSISSSPSSYQVSRVRLWFWRRLLHSSDLIQAISSKHFKKSYKNTFSSHEFLASFSHGSETQREGVSLFLHHLYSKFSIEDQNGDVDPLDGLISQFFVLDGESNPVVVGGKRLLREEGMEGEIMRDLDRTFPASELFKGNQSVG